MTVSIEKPDPVPCDQAIEVLQLENELYQLIAQIDMIADGLRENRDVESYPISLLLYSVIDKFYGIDYLTYHRNDTCIKEQEMMKKFRERGEGHV